MSKKKLKAKIKKLETRVVEARTSAIAYQIAKMLFHVATGETVSIPKEAQEGEPAIIGSLRRAAEDAASKAKAKAKS
jgi:hypothetical protein